MNEVIQAEKLTKYYGKARGIIDVDLVINEGEIFGFIGPNGAGKSTTIRTLLSLIHKTSGEAKIFGLDSEKDSKKILENVGYLPSEVFYYDNMRAIDLLNYSAGFYKKDCRQKIKMLSDALELDLNRKIEEMSLGNKKKVGIVQGLLHSPKLIILDEPTSGLDPLMQRMVFDLIKAESANGATVLFSSHILSEVQRICDRVSIIKDGRIQKTQRIDELRGHSYKKISFILRENATVQDIHLEGITNWANQGQAVSFLYKGDCGLLLKELAVQEIVNVDIADPSLEEIFLHYYTDAPSS
ncbi:MAG: ABC transporter ATP-binding protein [Clostridia bacterium]|nr:ABC transporter ATP-binding protein [Clostridia bacterium]